MPVFRQYRAWQLLCGQIIAADGGASFKPKRRLRILITDRAVHCRHEGRDPACVELLRPNLGARDALRRERHQNARQAPRPLVGSCVRTLVQRRFCRPRRTGRARGGKAGASGRPRGPGGLSLRWGGDAIRLRPVGSEAFAVGLAADADAPRMMEFAAAIRPKPGFAPQFKGERRTACRTERMPAVERGDTAIEARVRPSSDVPIRLPINDDVGLRDIGAIHAR